MLTRKQHELLLFIHERLKETGIPPSFDEMKEALALGVEASPLFVSKHFLWLTAFVGLNLFQSGFTRICPLENILRKFGVKDGPG